MNKTKILLAIIFILLAIIVTLSILLNSGHYCSQESLVEQQKKDSDSIIGAFSKVESFSEGYEILSGIDPKEGFIPDYKTAIRYAELLWRPIFGDKIYKEMPFDACLVGDSIWLVSGTLPKNTVGGTIEAILRKSDGKVLRVVHQK